MSFLWPGSLWALGALPLLPILYVWLLRRRGKAVLRYSHLAPVRAAAGPAWRRHVPPLVVFVAIALLLFAAARPTATIRMPWAHSTVLLAMDVSLSMRVTDVQPSRLVAAQAAAKAFVDGLPRHVEVGLVTFAGSAQVVQAATLDHAAVTSAIDAFQMQMGTAVGNAIVLCLAELFPDHGIDLAAMTFGPRSAFGPGAAVGRGGANGPASALKTIVPVKPASYPSAAIVLLSDGRRTTGVDTLEAARMAADRGVRIDVVGLGVVNGTASLDDGMAIYLKLDEPTLREVARLTGGEYFHAGTAERLQDVYKTLGSRLHVERRETELAPVLVLAGALLLAAATGLSRLLFAS